MKRYHPIKINNKVMRTIIIKKKRSSASLKKICTLKYKKNINNNMLTKIHRQKFSRNIIIINKEAINEKNIDPNMSPKMKTLTKDTKLNISQDTKNHQILAITKDGSRLPTSTKNKVAITK